jgi:cytochrome c biogenesis protein
MRRFRHETGALRGAAYAASAAREERTMIENTKCECGHQNPIGTVLCESCGKPTSNDAGAGLLEMRYDGVARRSQKANPNLIDRVWNFFSSVKVAVWLILITLAAAVIGTVLRQENTFFNPSMVDLERFYTEQYGTFGKIYYALGLTRTYETWWFKTLLFMIGTSLVVCSLDRVLPLYRALNKQGIRKHPQFLKRQRVSLETGLPPGYEGNGGADRWIEAFAASLRKKRYRVRVEGAALFAEKNRFSRWGPYVNHVGLIIFLLAALLRSLIPEWNTELDMQWVEGETKRIEGTPYYLKVNRFTEEYYEKDELPEALRETGQGVAKSFETDAVLLECVSDCEGEHPVLEERLQHTIAVNDPLKYDGLAIYQFHFEPTDQIVSMRLTLKREGEESEENLGTFRLDSFDMKLSQQAGSHLVEIEEYYPEFFIRDDRPATKSKEPVNPGYVLAISEGDGGERFRYLFVPKLGIWTELEAEGYKVRGEPSGGFRVAIDSEDDLQLARYKTFLTVRSHKGMEWIWTGAAIFMIGVIMGFYWQHRRVWASVDGGVLLVGAHTNKNWFSLRRETADALRAAGVEVQPNELDNGVKRH